jgi:Putative Ig domain
VGGTSFWTADAFSGIVYKFDIASGQLLEQINTGLGVGLGYVSGVAIYGEPTAATWFANIGVVATDSAVGFTNLSGVLPNVPYHQTVSFDTQFTGDGAPHSFDLLFVDQGTGRVLGSIPVTINVPPYVYPVQASDADGDALTYSLPVAPAGATIDPQTGRIDWQPAAVGTYHFRVQVSDGHGGRDTQDFNVVVDAGAGNDDPVISSTPATAARLNRAYNYQVLASDPDGDSLSYYLSTAPLGMTIDSTTGLISWTPTADEVGTQNVTVQVRDWRGGLTTQSFTITVSADSFDNVVPQFTSTPGTTAVAGQVYLYHATAFDADGDPIQFDLPVHPEGMAVDPASGVVAWRPTSDEVGVQNVVLRVQDDGGTATVQSYTINVLAQATPPIITSQPPLDASATYPYEYRARAQDADGASLAGAPALGPSGTQVRLSRASQRSRRRSPDLQSQRPASRHDHFRRRPDQLFAHAGPGRHHVAGDHHRGRRP